jgi:hypothetical protein
MRKLLLPILALILVLSLALPMAVPALAQSTSLWTDKQDYAPEEVVTISGSGFLANAEVAVTVERPDGVTDTVTPAPVTDDTGYFTCSYQLDGITGTYTVTATDGTNTATATFTDAVALAPTADSWVNDDNPGTNYGSDGVLHAKVDSWWFILWWVTNLRRSYLEFDLSGLPSGATIDSATLHLYRTTGDQIPSAYQTTDGWTEMGITWNNQPGPGASVANGVSEGGGWFKWNITSYAASEFAGDQILSVVLKFTTESGSPKHADFTSREGTSNQRPWLEISYSSMGTTPPLVNVTFPAANGLNGWFVTKPVVGTVTANDTTNVTAINVTINGVSATLTSFTGFNTPNATATFNVTAEGTNNIAANATDGQGNRGAAAGSNNTTTVYIDTVAPTLTKDLSGTLGLDNWYTSNVTVTLNGGDTGGSGLNRTEYNLNDGGWINYTVPFVISTEGSNTLQHRAYDNAGNVYVLANQTIKIDKTAPVVTITVPADAATYGLGQLVNANWSASDSGSGINATATSGTVPNGTAIDTGTVGSKTFTVTATDNAGNTQTRTVSYSVQYGSLKGLPVLYQSRSSTVLIRWQYTDYYGNVVDSWAADPDVYILRQGNGAPVLVSPQYISRTNTWQFNWPVRTSRTNLSYRIWIETRQTGQTDGPFFLHLINGWLPESPMW